MIHKLLYSFVFLLIGTSLFAQENQYGLSFANEQLSGNTLCVDIQLRFKNGGQLGSSNLVMKYNKLKYANPVYASEQLPSNQYITSSVTNPADSLAAFNIELINENDGLTIAPAPAKTTIGRLCFDVLAGAEAAVLDWEIKTTTATVIYLADETTMLKRGLIAAFCNNEGQPCDDGNANTTDDKFDVNCQCAGIQIACVDDENLDLVSIPERTYKSRQKIQSEGRIRTRANVEFRAGESIILGVGFHAEEGSNFKAIIEDCVDNIVEEVTESREKNSTLSNVKSQQLDKLSLLIAPNPAFENASITFALPQTENVNLAIYSIQGRLIKTLFAGPKQEGVHLLDWHTGNLHPGIFLLSMKTKNNRIIKKVVIQ